MRILFIAGIFPEIQYDKIINASSGVIQYAADVLQKAILKGFSQNQVPVHIVNLPFIGSYPERYSEKKIDYFKFSYDQLITGENIAFNNLKGFKLLSRYVSLKGYLKNYLKSSDQSEETVLLIYSLHTPFLKACIEIKKLFKKIKIIQIVPDLPEYMSGCSSFFRKKWVSYNIAIQSKMYTQIDGFILLSKFMHERFPNKIPWEVVEGIYDNDLAIHSYKPTLQKYIFYSGTLARRYGVMNLVEAFSSLKSTDISLYICGDGDSRNDILSYVAKDKRIKYLGSLKHADVLKLQQEAYLLVNPRTPEGDFTKYSFPSKTMEYFASGTPTLMYRLPGIPEEYYKYCYTVESLGVDELYKKMKYLISCPTKDLQQKGKMAQTFIYEKKNPKIQVRKILNLINTI